MFKIKLNKKYFQTLIKIGGTSAIGQVVALLSIPILSRNYGTSQFGELAYLQSIIAVSLTFSTLRFDYAISFSDESDDIYPLLALSILSSVLFSISIGFFSIGILDKSVLFGFLSGLLVFFSSINQAYTYTCIRLGKINSLSYMRILQSISLNVIPVVAIFLPDKNYLILGLLISTLIGVFFTFNYIYGLKVEQGAIAKVFKKYKDFMRLALPSNILNALAWQAMPLIISLMYIDSTAGELGMAIRLLSIPVFLLASSMSQTFVNSISNISDMHIIRDRFISTVKLGIVGALISLLSSILLFYFSDSILGEDWEASKVYIALLAPAYFMQMIVLPVSSLAAKLGENKAQLYMDFGRAVSLIAIYVYGFIGKLNPEILIALVSLIILAWYFVYIIKYNQISKKKIT